MAADAIFLAISDDELVAAVRKGPLLVIEFVPIKRIPMELTAWINVIEKRCGKGEE